ncbi:LytTR family DNA-binding domain-containing protein [Algoriphagus halophytocola]|uniref:LytTR family DNA-binding domain-containing protein n=1 Tax=Algoriphagus halophytocola TaxID=2991499 RepID=A0ABY6MGM3_9BACT|nr:MULTISPECIES: LytTR family DNA-binding domain-containing protein [unclassified Algoriphagus]UZD22947.1 LytTR family DNA-binding domain-containing protein [Algoriphagus sp. TR-M5]WBL44216.1 LytTR family DNA-binding domain-containing protein [Algoriphagus sp. TR-M9]
MIRTIIIEDEQPCMDHLVTLLEKGFKEEVELLGTFSSFEDGLEAISTLNPELVFLDIQLGNKSGFDLLKELEKIDFNLVFTTAYHQFAIDAFRFSAIDYLLKPIAPFQLKEALEKVQSGISKTDRDSKYQVLLESVNSTDQKLKKMVVPHINGFRILELSEVIRLQSDGNYTEIHLNNESKIVSGKTLKEYENRLLDYRFFRVHHSHLVNIDFIKSYTAGKGGYLTLKDNSQVEVSHRKKDSLMKYLKSSGTDIIF